MSSFDKFVPPALGWRRDLPDPRDFTLNHPRVESLLAGLCRSSSPLPTQCDLRNWGETSHFSNAEDQGGLNAASAFACLALIEYFERKTCGRTFEGSHRFVFEMGRKVARLSGNSALGIRDTLKVIQRFGTPPEELYPYHPHVDDDILNDASFIGYATDLPVFTYFRIDHPGRSGDAVLSDTKAMIAAGFPVILGFPVPRSMTTDGLVPFRPRFDSYRGGQTVLAIGYDDHRIAKGQGAILIRNSWGTKWGDKGYGWLPYAYLTQHLAADFWTLLSEEWADPSELSAPLR